jgi:uncharacterized membrane protein YeaQ/YmgE (transglycosylase-associated protein family)
MANSVLGWLLIGLIAGVLGKLIMPGRDPGGLIITVLLGIAGALLAGYVSIILGADSVTGIARYVYATLGAVIILVLYRLIMHRRIR